RLRSLRNEAFVQGKSHFVSSPKKRCVETLGPLQRAISSGELFISPQLDEQQENENNEGFRVRVENFMNSLMEGPWNWIFLCSHGDWLPFALEYLQNENILMRKAAWVEYEIIGYRRILTWVVPDSRLFCANSEF
ncbi:MAG: hypothetical protein KDD35_06815, partial [Bdellovibrionales bacterium]|nr:hypothetical protein [Bdellovibrionales bacterium]